MPKISVDTIPDREVVLDADSILGSDVHKKLEINEIARQSVRVSWCRSLLGDVMYFSCCLGQAIL